MMNFAAARQNMIEGQLRPNRVIDERLLGALSAVAREAFVPGAAKDLAYIDEAIALPGGRRLLEPMVLGRLLQEAELRTTDKVLDIGGGSGYGAALLSQLVAKVVMLEEKSSMAAEEIGKLKNVSVVTGALTEGHAAEGPYNVILIEGGIAVAPEKLFSQLAEGGRLLAVKNGKGPVGQAVIWQKIGGVVAMRSLFDAGVATLEAFAAPTKFVL